MWKEVPSGQTWCKNSVMEDELEVRTAPYTYSKLLSRTEKNELNLILKYYGTVWAFLKQFSWNGFITSMFKFNILESFQWGVSLYPCLKARLCVWYGCQVMRLLQVSPCVESVLLAWCFVPSPFLHLSCPGMNSQLERPGSVIS